MRSGRYRNITGNTATAYGLVAAAHRAGPLLLGSYPITPASEILHVLSQVQEAVRRDHLPGRG
jgi:2-oxoglutarate ferredoxin oxidoreductase subunit alpha